MSVSSYVFPTSGLGFARSACIAAFSGVVSSGMVSSGLVVASYEAGEIYTYNQTSLIPLANSPYYPSYLFNSQTYTNLGGDLPTTQRYGGLEFLAGGFGGISWTSTAYTGTEALQEQVTNGGLLGFNSNIPSIAYTVIGNESFQFNYQIIDSAPQELLVQVYEATLGWHSFYLGTDEFNLGGYNAGAITGTLDSWASVTVTASDLGLTAGMIITGLAWGIWNASGTSTVIFSDFTSSASGSLVTQFMDCDQDGANGFYVLARQALVYAQNPSVVPEVLPLATSPSYLYTGLVYNTNNNIPYFIGYDGTIYKYLSSVVSTVTSPPSGISVPARQLWSSGTDLFTLFENSNVVANYSIAGNSWSTTTLPFTAETYTITYSKILNQILAGGSNYIDLHISDTIEGITYALTPNQVLVAESSNLIKIYNYAGDGGAWSLAQTVSGTGNPTSIAAIPDGTQAVVTDSTNNLVQILEYVAGTWTQQGTLSLTDPTNVSIYTGSLTQALVCQPSNNSISVLNKGVSSWTVAQTITSISGPTDVSVLSSGKAAVVSTSTGVTFLTFNGVVWQNVGSLVLNPVPTATGVDLVNTNNSLLYASGSDGTNTKVYVFQNQTQAGSYIFSGASTLTLDVLNFQIASSVANGAIDIGYYVGGEVSNSVVSGVTAPTNPVSTTYVSQGIDYLPNYLIAGAHDIYTFRISQPQKISRIADSHVAVLSGASWSTIDLLDRNPISSITTDVSGNIFAITTDNDLYKIINSTTVVASGYPYSIPPPAGQESNIPLGFSKLLYWNGNLWASSSFAGGLLKIESS